jgi:hypothetical protein
MPLEFSPLEIPYGQLDTHTDPTAMEPGTLTTAQNVSSDVDGRYSKRFGYTTLLNAPGTVGVRLAKRGDELIAYDRRIQRKYVHELTTWQDWVGSIPHAKASEDIIALDQGKDFIRCTRASCSGMTLHAWIDNNTGDVVVKVLSQIDGSVLASYTDSTSDYEIVHAVAMANTRIVVFYSSVTSQVIRYRTFEPAALSFGTLTTYQSGANVYAGSVPYPYAPFDIVAFSATDVCFAWATNTPDIRVIRRNVAAHSDSTAAVILSTEVPDGGFAIETASATVGLVAFHSSTAAAVRGRGFNPTTSAALYALMTIHVDIASHTNFNIGMTEVNSTNIMVIMDWRRVSPNVGRTVAKTVDSAGTTTLNATVYNVWVAGKPWTHSSRQYTPVIAPNSTQETYFTLDYTADGLNQPVPVAMHAYRTAYAGGPAVACLSNADNVSTNVYAYDAPLAFKLLNNSNTNSAVATFVNDYGDARIYQNTEVGNSVLSTGGVTFQYDGEKVFENNFLVYPHVVSATAGAVGGGGMNNGTYSYLIVYEVSDKHGNVDRSTTSLPISATTAAGAGLGKVDLVIRSLNVTHHVTSTRKVTAAIFRTEAGGETYYFVNRVTADCNVETVAYTDSANDSTILSNRIIYTQGGIQDREPAPPCDQLVLHNNRVWGFTKKTVFYSGDYLPGENAWFSTLQRFSIDAGGDITALASLDEKLIIFKRDRIFKVSGRGMNAQGQSSDLTPPDVITADCGCIESRSVVVIPQGVMFQSSKGLYMLTRGEELTFIGMPVSAYLEDFPTITAATMMPAIREVRFQVSDGSITGAVLVYNYRDNRWTTHTNYDHLGSGISGNRMDSLILDGVYYTLDASAKVMKEGTGFRDVDISSTSHYVVSEIETGWIKPAGKQGLARCQRMTFLNEFMDDHELEIEIDKDYVDTAVQTVEFTSAEIESFPEEQVSIHIQNQQGEAWRIRMTDATSAGVTTGEGFRAKGVTFLVGAKRGTVEKIMQAGAKG